jgi:hypothetical protein
MTSLEVVERQEAETSEISTPEQNQDQEPKTVAFTDEENTRRDQKETSKETPIMRNSSNDHEPINTLTSMTILNPLFPIEDSSEKKAGIAAKMAQKAKNAQPIIFSNNYYGWTSSSI